VNTDTVLSRREATLRSAATTCLAGIALVQAIELPSLFGQGRQFAFLAMAAMALCIVVGWALAAAPAEAERPLWGAVAVTGVLMLAGSAVPHAVAVPALADARGDWGSMPGAACAALAAGCLVLAAVAAPPTRAAVRGLATAVGVLVAFAPGVAVLLFALGPGVPGGETVLAAGGHIHAHGSPENAIVFQPFPGGHGGHYVYKAVAQPHQTAFGVVLIVAATLVFVYGAVGHLRRRATSGGTVALGGLEGGLA
jgi:hypothetical protein